MALSSSEHTLLVNTCDNMNIAASTCSQVLDMLRNLGASGVVDIATHNNSQAVHEDAKNLAHINPSDYSLSLGEKGAVSNWPTSYPMSLSPLSNVIKNNCETKGNNSTCFLISSYKAVNNSSNELIELSNAGSSLPYSGLSVNIESRIHGLNNSASVNYASNIAIGHGDPAHASNFLYSNVFFIIGNGSGSGVRSYTFASEYINSSVAPSLGLSNSPFSTAYFQTAATVVSDRREKNGVEPLDLKAVDFVKSLRPVSYMVSAGVTKAVEVDGDGNATKFDVTPGVRRHWGLIAQDVQEALASAGYDPSDCAVWQLSDKGDPDSKQALRYEELIAPLVKAVQVLAAKVEALEGK